MIPFQLKETKSEVTRLTNVASTLRCQAQSALLEVKHYSEVKGRLKLFRLSLLVGQAKVALGMRGQAEPVIGCNSSCAASMTARRGIRRSSDEAKRCTWRGYFEHNARMRSAIGSVSAASAETNEYNRNN
ncbi:hypothetical protein EVAR_39414_1 [Eumeta japonica]|uniref:Uncharacterized protein n=1 Tax=Eumeta variegata TaxID=151549 RepID=A0A4C1Z0G3_EUMVA|nr:hypothetical protein EVAR_39414_1 [Eumeta japonica]